MRSTNLFQNEQGFSLFNILAALSMVAILSATAVSNLKVVENPLADASFSLNHYLRLVRSRGISQTTFIRLTPVSATRIVAFRGNNCEETDVEVDDLAYIFPDNTALTDTEWEVCFTPRGLAEDSASFSIRDHRSYTRDVEIALGGGSRIL